MSNPDERIAQFEHMAAEDPDNAMAHFSLGSAYLGAQRHADAAASFQQCIKLNSEMSKAYQLAAAALIDSGDEDRAAEILITGYEVAARRGDMMPHWGVVRLAAYPRSPGGARGDGPERMRPATRYGRAGDWSPQPGQYREEPGARYACARESAWRRFASIDGKWERMNSASFGRPVRHSEKISSTMPAAWPTSPKP